MQMQSTTKNGKNGNKTEVDVVPAGVITRPGAGSTASDGVMPPGSPATSIPSSSPEVKALTKEDKFVLLERFEKLEAAHEEALAKASAAKAGLDAFAKEVHGKMGGGPWGYKGRQISVRNSPKRPDHYIFSEKSREVEELG